MSEEHEAPRGRPRSPRRAKPIVGRILEEHGGRIELRDASEKYPGERGAWLRLRFTTEHTDSEKTKAVSEQ